MQLTSAGDCRAVARNCLAAGEFYSNIGRPSVDPVVFFKLQLIAFFEGIRSERQLMESVNLNLAQRWFIGYDLESGQVGRSLPGNNDSYWFHHRCHRAKATEDFFLTSSGYFSVSTSA